MHVDADVLTYNQGFAHVVDTCQRLVMKEELAAFQGIHVMTNFVDGEYNTNGYLGADNIGEYFVGVLVDGGNNQRWILGYVDVYTDQKYW